MAILIHKKYTLHSGNILQFYLSQQAVQASTRVCDSGFLSGLTVGGWEWGDELKALFQKQQK